jgi:hypothetical protein
MLKIIAITIGMLLSASVYACRYSPQYSPASMGELAKEAQYVVSASLAKATSGSSGRYKVHRWLKGSGPDTIEILGFGRGTDCRTPMVADRSLIFLSYKENVGYLLREERTYAGSHLATRENIAGVVLAISNEKERDE